eukprot:gene18109-24542_t
MGSTGPSASASKRYTVCLRIDVGKMMSGLTTVAVCTMGMYCPLSLCKQAVHSADGSRHFQTADALAAVANSNYPAEARSTSSGASAAALDYVDVLVSGRSLAALQDAPSGGSQEPPQPADAAQGQGRAEAHRAAAETMAAVFGGAGVGEEGVGGLGVLAAVLGAAHGVATAEALEAAYGGAAAQAWAQLIAEAQTWVEAYGDQAAEALAAAVAERQRRAEAQEGANVEDGIEITEHVELAEMSCHQHHYSVAISPCGHYIVAGGEYSRLYIYHNTPSPAPHPPPAGNSPLALPMLACFQYPISNTRGMNNCVRFGTFGGQSRIFVTSQITPTPHQFLVSPGSHPQWDEKLRRVPVIPGHASASPDMVFPGVQSAEIRSYATIVTRETLGQGDCPPLTAPL